MMLNFIPILDLQGVRICPNMRSLVVILITLSYTVNGEQTDTDKEDTDYYEVGIDSTSTAESNFRVNDHDQVIEVVIVIFLH